MATNNPATPLPYFFVGKDLTQQRIDSFLENKNNILSNALGKTDTRSIWYSKDHISKLLDEIDRYSGDGLRICFGAYESGHEYAGQLCLMMIVTTANGEGHANLYIEEQADFEDRSALPRSISLFPGEGGKKDMNFGSPCPPRCD